MLTSLLVVVIVAAVVYGLIYYFVPAGRGKQIMFLVAGVILLLWLVSILAPGLISRPPIEPG